MIFLIRQCRLCLFCFSRLHQLTTSSRFDCVCFCLQTGGRVLCSKQIYHRQLTNNMSWLSLRVVNQKNQRLSREEDEGGRAHLFLSGNEEHPCSRRGRSQPASVKNTSGNYEGLFASLFHYRERLLKIHFFN